MFTHEETIAHIIDAQRGDGAALDALTRDNIALVRSIVRRYLGRGAEYDDLFQLGSLGLVKAILHFDVRFQVRFSTYAVPMIAGEIKRFLRDDGPVKVSRSLRELAAKALALSERLGNETGRSPALSEIAEALAVSPEDVAAALDAARPVVSLSEPLYDDNTAATREDTLPAPGNEEALTDRILLSELIGTLDTREKQIIMLRYFRDCTQSQVAVRLGISQVQVSRLESRILRRMRERAGAGPDAATACLEASKDRKTRAR